ncbi:MAG: CHASE domain-containing protein [Caldilineaceae bacterium]
MAAFYAASTTMTRQEFSTFVKPFLASRPAVAAIAWIPRVQAEDRLAYETAARREIAAETDFSDFTFTEYNTSKLVPARTRAEYYPIYYQEPMLTDSISLGFDLGSNSTYLAALKTARNRAQPVIIEQVAFADKRELSQLIIQVIYPIYAVDAPATTLQTRLTEIVGFVAIVLRVHEVIAGVLQTMTPDTIHLDIYEQSSLTEQRRLYHYPTAIAHDPKTVALSPLSINMQTIVAGLTITRTFSIAGQQWRLVLQPTAAYVIDNQGQYHWFIFVAGLLLTSGATAYFHLLLHRNYQSNLMVDERTEQLRQTNQQLQVALQELQFQKTLLECTSEAAQDGILIVSPERKWLFFNQRFLDMWQIPQEIAYRRSSEEGIQWVVAQVANSQKSRQTIEALYAQPDAKSYSEVTLKSGAVFERYSAPVKQSNEVIYGRVWYFRDISQRKQIEEALRQSEARNRALVSAIPDLLFRVRKDGTFLDYDGAPGYTPTIAPENFLGRNVDELFPVETAQRLKERIAHVLTSGEPKLVEYQMPMLDGEVRWWEQRVVVINEEEVLLIVRDITDRKQAEAALLISQQQLQERQRYEKQVVEEGLARVQPTGSTHAFGYPGTSSRNDCP